MHPSPSVPVLKRFLARWLLPVVVAVSMGSFFIARAFERPLEMVVLAVTVGALLLAMAVERLLPFNPVWNRSHDDGSTDLASAVVLVGLAEPLLKYVAPLGVVAFYGYLDIAGVYVSVLGQLPFLLQLLVVTLLIELGRYWSHRLHHRLPSLWWLHAMHHSSRRLYAFNNLRFHPVNYGVNFALSIFPLMLIGVPAEILLGYLALTQPVVMLQHANADLRNGVLNYVFSTNELHRWHHSSARSEADCNFGNALILWDQVFGTFRYKPQGNDPSEVGLFSNDRSAYPAQASYWRQLTSLWSRECCGAGR